ncbi:eukaryotic translation initiation factor 4 gamma 3 isoform X1 [Bemisia tabaci]|uniref:eukaryotic translation initiation factor 4 gamma 3 isoform X1 n=1 Tax=Bemisia tabaci TaxID=7038 RepID=UPI003B27D586
MCTMSAFQNGASTDNSIDQAKKIDQILDLMRIFNARQLNFAQRLNQINATVDNLNKRLLLAESKTRSEEEVVKPAIAPESQDSQTEVLKKESSTQTLAPKLKCQCKSETSSSSEDKANELRMTGEQAQFSPVSNVIKTTLTNEEIFIDPDDEDIICALHKLNSVHVDDVAKEIIMLPMITKERRIAKLVDEIIKIAIDQPKNCAVLCKKLSLSLKMDRGHYLDDRYFRRRLLNVCQSQFDNEMMTERVGPPVIPPKRQESQKEKGITSHQKYLNQCKKNEFRHKRRQFCRFLGHLFNEDMLNVPVMHGVLICLFLEEENSSIEIVCDLILSIGDHYYKRMQDKNKHSLQPIISRLTELDTENSQDDFPKQLVSLVLNNWVIAYL